MEEDEGELRPFGDNIVWGERAYLPVWEKPHLLAAFISPLMSSILISIL